MHGRVNRAPWCRRPTANPPALVAVAPEATAPIAIEAGPSDGVDWSKVPPLAPLPRPGAFNLTPTSPGYYSLLDAITGTYRETPPKFPYPPVSP